MYNIGISGTKGIVRNRSVGVIEVGIVRSLISGPRILFVRWRSVGIIELRILLRVAFLEQRELPAIETGRSVLSR